MTSVSDDIQRAVQLGQDKHDSCAYGFFSLEHDDCGEYAANRCVEEFETFPSYLNCLKCKKFLDRKEFIYSHSHE